MRATPSDVQAASAKLDVETTVPALLSATARTIVELIGASACTISRVIGDLLVDLTQHRMEGEPLRLGHGYLVSDYPLTREVIEELEVRTVFVSDPEADPDEARLLGELGFDSLLMVPLTVGGGVWGLVEVYGDGARPFDEEDAEIASQVVQAAGESLARLEGQS